jgi:hypothetical protein
MLNHDRDWPVPTKRQDTCAEFIQDDTQSIDIAPLISGISANLFWREIE